MSGIVIQAIGFLGLLFFYNFLSDKIQQGAVFVPAYGVRGFLHPDAAAWCLYRGGKPAGKYS